jgi:hypothetical protein
MVFTLLLQDSTVVSLCITIYCKIQLYKNTFLLVCIVRPSILKNLKMMIIHAVTWLHSECDFYTCIGISVLKLLRL